MGMTLDQIINELGLSLLTEKKDFSSITPTHGYVSDMLSCVMTGAKNKSIWVTLQAHNNIVAVACLLDIAAVIITEGSKPDADTIKKANEEGITLLFTENNSFSVVGRLWQLGLRDQ
jgi:AICAR transformylase/IMP cyclohydrolase PurH